MLYRMLIHSWDIFRRLILESEKLMTIEIYLLSYK